MNRGSKPKVIYIDCTETYFSGLNTGIQRVVTQITTRSSLLSDETGIPCIPVVGLGGKYYRLEDLRSKQKSISENILKLKHRVRSIYYQVRSSLVSTNVPSNSPLDNGKAVVAPSSGEIGKEYFLIMLEHRIRNFVGQIFATIQKLAFRVTIKNMPNVKFGSGNLLLVPDGFFGRYYDLVALENAHLAKASVIPLIYDLFPITHPELCHEENVRIYPLIFEKVLPFSIGIMTISKSGMQDLKDYLESIHAEYMHLPVRYFHLGGDFLGADERFSRGDGLSNLLPLCLANRRFYLVVGTIEPRKDHMTILEAFEQLWLEGFDASLVFVGRIGWKCDDILQKIRNSEHRDTRLFFLGSIDDETLFSLYTNAEALVFSSIVEGFGLPLVEAMNMGIPVIVSDIPVFREVGGEYPFYFSVRSPSNLARVVLEFDRLKSNSKLLPKISKRWHSWDESAVSYIRNALDIYKISLNCRD